MFYYNPCSEYQGKDLTSKNEEGNTICGTTWKALNVCSNLKLPYPPIGIFLSFNHYNKTNQSSLYSDGKGKAKDWGSFRQTLHWGQSKTGGEISRTCRSGPGPFWIKTYSTVRDMYYPNGINFNNNKWSITCNMSSSLKNHGCLYDKPSNWTDGFKEGEFIEVTHSGVTPGMPQSIGYWLNGFPGGGSGIFLKIGRTHIANNKVDCLFTLLLKLQQSSMKDLEH